jgi:rubredoxin
MRRVNRYRCGKCPYIYDPRKGDPEGGIPPGTPFSRIPAGWRCPVCGAKKSDFYPIEESASPVPEKAAGITASQPLLSLTGQPATRQPDPPTRPTAAAESWTVGSLRARPPQR